VEVECFLCGFAPTVPFQYPLTPMPGRTIHAMYGSRRGC
jgi:hypothetical protein